MIEFFLAIAVVVLVMTLGLVFGLPWWAGVLVGSVLAGLLISRRERKRDATRQRQVGV